MLKGWISYAGSNIEEGKRELAQLGIIVGYYDTEKRHFADCYVTNEQLRELGNKFGRFVWGLDKDYGLSKNEAPVKCSNCNHCNLLVDEVTNAEARCTLKKRPKIGKKITWACTVYPSLDDLHNKDNKEMGIDRVKRVLNNMKKAPSWCPLKEETI